MKNLFFRSRFTVFCQFVSLVFVLTGCPSSNKEPDPKPLEDAYGSLIFNTKNVDQLTTLKVNGDDHTGIVNASEKGLDPCKNKDLHIKVKIGQKNTLFADNGLIQWNLNDVIVSEKDQCKAIILDVSNSTSTPKSAVKFSNNGETGTRGIQLYLDDVNTALLNESKLTYSNTSPTASTFTTTISAGEHIYRAVSQNGHVWEGKFTAENGTTAGILLQKNTAKPVPSDKNNIIFYSPTYNNIIVNLNNVQIGAAAVSYAPTTADLCTRRWLVSIINPLGTYTYTASDNLGHSWSGTVKATVGGGCTMVQLN
ncbi:hypothetical protein ACS5NO_17515 [Larkinella sp. GY13]|uniref:hypothetical protein n=1 Tax=Larkinella sp. GY13 TaxID=3453720 RepID=UPI003EE9CCD4